MVFGPDRCPCYSANSQLFQLANHSRKSELVAGAKSSPRAARITGMGVCFESVSMLGLRLLNAARPLTTKPLFMFTTIPGAVSLGTREDENDEGEGGGREVRDRGGGGEG